MKETFYFPHDYTAHNDPKMMYLLTNCGLSAIGMYWVIIEILHQEPESKITEESFRNYIKFFCQNENRGEEFAAQLEQVLNSSGLLFNKNGYVFSNRVLQNKKIREEMSKKRSFAGKKSAEKRAKTSKKATSVQQNSTSVEQNSTKERKRKERKRKENNISKSHCDASVAVAKDNDPVNKIMEVFYKINPALNWGNKTSRAAADWLVKKFTLEGAIGMAEMVISVHGKPFAPTATTPWQMKEKLSQFKAYFDKEKESHKFSGKSYE